MARLKTKANLEATPEQIAAAFCSSDFLVAIEKSRREVVDAKYILVEQSDRATIFNIEITGNKHKKTNLIDSPITNTVQYHWEPDKQILRFNYKGSDRILVNGIYLLRPEATGSQLKLDAEITVRIPIASLIIANLIKKELNKSFAKIVARIEERFS